METLVSEEPPADIEAVHESIGSAPAQSGGAPDLREDNRYLLQKLLKSAIRGVWEDVKNELERDPELMTAILTSRFETVLHVATLGVHDQFVENLVRLMSPHPEALEMPDRDGRTALHNAVLCGRIRMVKALVRNNGKLTQLPEKGGRIPLQIAAVEASMHKEIAWFLAEYTTEGMQYSPRRSPIAIDTIIDLTYAGHHDITLFLLSRYDRLITMRSTRGGQQSVLDALASMGSHFPSGTRLSILEAFIYKCIPVNLDSIVTERKMDEIIEDISAITSGHFPEHAARRTMSQFLEGLSWNATKSLWNATQSLWNATQSLWTATIIAVPKIKKIREVKLRHMGAVRVARTICKAVSLKNSTESIEFFQEEGAMVEAAVNGISELVKLFFQFFPEVIWISPSVMSLMTYVVKYRQERILRFFLKVSSNNGLSLVPAPTHGESKRMMEAVTEYKPNFYALPSVSGAAFEMQRELQWFEAVESWTIPSVRTTKHGETTYWNTFVENHKELLEKGEKWVKDTSNSCMIVSTLIATVLFTAVFTVPGGNNGNTGVPLLLGQNSVLVFAISDALGLFSSVTAILIFLAISTSRYVPQDFLHSLPKKIIMGLCFLFLSLAFMLVAFVATLTIVLDTRVEWILIPITSLASIPVASFGFSQLPLLYQMIKSTYGPSIFYPESIGE